MSRCAGLTVGRVEARTCRASEAWVDRFCSNLCGCFLQRDALGAGARTMRPSVTLGGLKGHMPTSSNVGCVAGTAY